MKPLMLVVGLIMLLAAFGLLGSGLVHQIAPTPGSTGVYQYSPASPSNTAQPFSGARTNAFTASSGGGTLTYTGVSLLVYTTTRDTTVFWTLTFSVVCGGSTLATGTANVYAYLGNPTATAWATIPAQSGSTVAAMSCILTVSRTGGQDGGSLYWVSEVANANVHGLWVWGQPQGAPPPATSGTTPTAQTDTSSTAPPAPTRPAVDLPGTAATIAMIFLIVFGVIFVIMGLFE